LRATITRPSSCCIMAGATVRAVVFFLLCGLFARHVVCRAIAVGKFRIQQTVPLIGLLLFGQSLRL
jgi:hypothetical protein